jgi:streptomycin 6-kinase
MTVGQLQERVNERVREWGLLVEDSLETQSSFIVFGKRANRPVVLKVLRQPGDEWRSGEVLNAFNGMGVVRVLEYVGGAVLLERLSPGTSLMGLALSGRDEEATEILIEVIQRMCRASQILEGFVTVEDWGKGFQRYLESGDNQVPESLVVQGRELYTKLCASQRRRRLLHGDLQHYNVLFDTNRGWLAIDPKGVVGEIEYEVGASLRNPHENPAVFASPDAVERRLKRFEAGLKLDRERALGWGFAQAVLSAIWSVEDGFAVDAKNPSIILANAIRGMLL